MYTSVVVTLNLQLYTVSITLIIVVVTLIIVVARQSAGVHIIHRSDYAQGAIRKSIYDQFTPFTLRSFSLSLSSLLLSSLLLSLLLLSLSCLIMIISVLIVLLAPLRRDGERQYARRGPSLGQPPQAQGAIRKSAYDQFIIIIFSSSSSSSSSINLFSRGRCCT